MNWIQDYDLFLFDFDGLLVDTEELHFKAYQMLCESKGCKLPWTLDEFFEIAHKDAQGIKLELQRLFPQMLEETWDVLYSEKKKLYENLLEKGEVRLMPGAEALLKQLAEQGKKRCVVTNSTQRQIEAIKAQIPVLQTIPRWFTRESYERPKPAPDGYLVALKALKEDGDRVIGFEDSMRGYESLKSAGVETTILICPPSHPQLKNLGEEIRYVPSFESLS